MSWSTFDSAMTSICGFAFSVAASEYVARATSTPPRVDFLPRMLNRSV